jgi:hypothetical protein
VDDRVLSADAVAATPVVASFTVFSRAVISLLLAVILVPWLLTVVDRLVIAALLAATPVLGSLTVFSSETMSLAFTAIVFSAVVTRVVSALKAVEVVLISVLAAANPD